MRVGGLVLAAGEGSRFGGTKQLAPLGGRPLLEHALASVAVLDPRVVVLGHEAQAILAAVDLRGVEAVVCEDWREGQAASLRCGLLALGDRGVPQVVDDVVGVPAEGVQRPHVVPHDPRQHERRPVVGRAVAAVELAAQPVGGVERGRPRGGRCGHLASASRTRREASMPDTSTMGTPTPGRVPDPTNTSPVPAMRILRQRTKARSTSEPSWYATDWGSL